MGQSQQERVGRECAESGGWPMTLSRVMSGCTPHYVMRLLIHLDSTFVSCVVKLEIVMADYPVVTL